MTSRYWEFFRPLNELTTKQEELREKLIQATLAKLEISGLQSIRARDLANEVGCAVGTIYNLVGDLDDLILLACERSLTEFEEFAVARFEQGQADNLSHLQLLELMGATYVEFATAHKKRWQANFEVSFDENSGFYRAYVGGQTRLLNLIVVVLKDVSPDTNDRELASIARALWASVHGISMLALSNPSKPLPCEKILQQCKRVIEPVYESLSQKKVSSG